MIAFADSNMLTGQPTSSSPSTSPPVAGFRLAQADVPPAEQRISTLVGDRVCVKCGYNLVGQPIMRESHYNMLIVRCPECATVASVQEYPLLGRWANRWAAVFAACWLLLIVAMWAGSSMALFGFSMGSAEMAAEPYGDNLYSQFSRWQAQQNAASGGGTTSAPAAAAAAPGTVIVTAPNGRITVVSPSGLGASGSGTFGSWWSQQNQVALLRNAGGIFGGFSIFVWYLLAWEAVVAIALGIVWATILLGRQRPGLLLWAVAIILGAAAVCLIPITDWLTGQPAWTYQASRRQIGPPVMGMALAWGGMWLTLGLMIGRPAARGLIRIMLPPRLRTSLAFLWLADGLDAPHAR